MFIKIGYQNLLNVERILAVVGPDAAPVKRMIQDAKDRGSLIDASAGRKTKTVIVMDSDHIVLSALTPVELQKYGLPLNSVGEETNAGNKLKKDA